MSSPKNSEIRVRFAPSPTGFLHVGGLRTALFNYLFARKNNGSFVLRIEDTDRKRYIPGAQENLINTFKQMGLDYDEGPVIGGNFGPYIQSERTEHYQKYAQELIDKGAAYYCFCTEKRLNKLRDEARQRNETVMYDGACRNLSQEEVQKKLADNVPHVVRLKIPKEGTTVFYDVVRERVEVENALVDDQVIIKSDGFPTYHLANVVDDHLMKISHVIRGEEWLISVPKHIFMYESLGWKVPKFVHLPLLLNPDKTKLSKRQGDVAVEDYLAKGYLPEALINFVAILGWHAKEDRELYTLDELVKVFSLKRISKSGAVFDVEKLNWMNGWYLRNLSLDYIAEKAKSYFEEAGLDVSNTEKYLKVVDNARNRSATIPEMITHSEMFYNDLEFSDKHKKITNTEVAKRLYEFWIEKLESTDDLSEEFIKMLIKETTEKLGLKGKDLYFPLRLALFGDVHGPDIPMIVDILGREEVIARLNSILHR
ncbi:MAG TPA: glutamate--tRNA ligase [Candidatus Cloacimonetes bacterium]|nr:glutamate--tRNA ligase [Candidatus Cloacimonadota bacterium]HEX38322.1 glutamate--tRNA ligase [Candidatus Cloacimonadota bacterium]